MFCFHGGRPSAVPLKGPAAMKTEHSSRPMVHHNLRVFQRSLQLARVVYENLPANSALRDQVKRASLSVGANIAEGCTTGAATVGLSALRDYVALPPRTAYAAPSC